MNPGRSIHHERLCIYRGQQRFASDYSELYSFQRLAGKGRRLDFSRIVFHFSHRKLAHREHKSPQSSADPGIRGFSKPNDFGRRLGRCPLLCPVVNNPRRPHPMLRTRCAHPVLRKKCSSRRTRPARRNKPRFKTQKTMRPASLFSTKLRISRLCLLNTSLSAGQATESGITLVRPIASLHLDHNHYLADSKKTTKRNHEAKLEWSVLGNSSKKRLTGGLVGFTFMSTIHKGMLQRAKLHSPSVFSRIILS